VRHAEVRRARRGVRAADRDPGTTELGRALPGQRVGDRASRPPVDPRLLRIHPSVRRSVAALAVLALATSLALIGQATAIAAIVARTFLDGATLADHGAWLALLAGSVVLRALASWGSDVVGQRTAARVKSTLRQRGLERASLRGPGDREGSVGELATVLTDGIDALDGTFAGYLPALVFGVLVPLILLGWVLSVDLTSGVILAITLPLIPLFMVLIGLAARAATRARFRALGELSDHLLAVLQGLTTIRVARATDRMGQVVREAAQRLRRTTLETLRVAFLSALVLELFAALAVATVAVVAGVRLAEGTGITLEPVLVALLLAPEAFWPLRRIGQQFHANEDGAAAAERLLDLIDEATDASGTVGVRGPAPDPSRSPIVLAAVTVAFEDRPLPALDRVDLTLRPGERVAVLGASGAGKTTLAAVMLGLRSPTSGAVTVGGVPLSELQAQAWHDRVAWVPQDPAPLRGTVRELLVMGVTDGTVEERAIEGALRAVGLDREVGALPDGLDTLVGPAGRGLSAGQRRRLALARSLLRPAGLVVLDEPTSDLDVESERHVRTALEALGGSRTVVVLTHRVSLAATADRVVVLEDGRVVDDGSPAELLRSHGAYADLVAASRPLDPAEVGHVGDPSERTIDPSCPAVGQEAPADPDDAASDGASLWPLLRPHRRALALAVGAGTLTPLAGVVLVVVSTYLISRSALRPNLLDLTVVIVAVRALSLTKAVSRYVERLSAHDVALRVVVDLRTHAYRRLARQAPAGLARFRSGDVLARVVGDVERLQLALVRGVVPLLGGLGAAVVIVVVAGILLPAAAPVAVVGMAAAGLGVPLLAWRLAQRPERALATARGQLTAEIVELLQAAPELRLLGQLGAARRRVDELDAEVVRRDRSIVARGGGADALVQVALGGMVGGLVLVGVPAVTDGRLAGVVLGALVVLGIAAAEAVGPLPPATQALANATAAAARLREVLDAPVPAPDPDPKVAGKLRQTGGAETFVPWPVIHVDRATAHYPGWDQPAVVDLEVRIAPGRSVAVVGRSGAGKSTLGHLAVRFLDPEGGAVTLDGVDLRHLTGDHVRANVALATQDAHVFAGTIRSNLRLAAPDAGPDQLDAALSAAHLQTWITSLPDGIDTLVGEDGSRLSGGQRHRLALARTLLIGAPLLVLDEPTADLDPITGRRFLIDALRAAGDRGLLLLTHDLRALPLVDEVVVLDRGRIAARGTHERLLAEDPDYADRWNLDTGDDASVGHDGA
jgi:ATP-binding cassette, subfamily C, bacterial CydCD